jgi:hypothetical protein
MIEAEGARRITAPETPLRKSSSGEDVATQRFCEEDIALENAVVDDVVLSANVDWCAHSRR